jgi:hypothetical protein
MQTFAAAVTGASGGVTWTVNDFPGGDGSVGTIDNSGRYLAPSSVPSPNPVTIRATSVSTPTASGTAAVTVLPLPSITSVSPASFPAGSFTLTVDGADFTAGAVVSLGGTPLSTVFVSANRLTASGTASSAGSFLVVATMSDGTVSNSRPVTVTAPASIAVSVSPAAAMVRVRHSRQFTAAVTGTSNTAVVWTVNGIAGGNTTIGKVSSSGLYSAPRQVPSPATVSVSATSAADPTKTAAATVTVTR